MPPPSHQSVVVNALSALLIATGLLLPSVAQTQAQARFEFLAPPSTERYHIYRVDTRTGAMAVCWFNGTHTECLQGTGIAGPQAPGQYSLRRSENPLEKGVFRVELTSGAISNCWFQRSNAALVCAHPVR